MERPDIGKPVVEPGGTWRLIATCQSIAEAEAISEQYDLMGYQTKIIKKMQGRLSLFEVWASKTTNILT